MDLTKEFYYNIKELQQVMLNANFVNDVYQRAYEVLEHDLNFDKDLLKGLKHRANLDDIITLIEYNKNKGGI